MLDWIILECLNCDVDRARETGWQAQAVLSEPASLFGWTPEQQSRRFTTRAECLRMIRREHREGESGPDRSGQLTTVTHHPDYVEQFEALPGEMNGAVNYGCFSAAPVTG